MFLLLPLLLAGAKIGAAQERQTAKPGSRKPAPDYLPAKLELFIGSFGGDYSSVSLTGETLTYSHGPFRPNSLPDVKIKPTKKQWQDFWKALAAIKIWRWESHYRNDNTVDGTAWRVEIAQSGAKGLKIDSGGRNAYPEMAEINASAPKAFDTPALECVRKLGIAFFQPARHAPNRSPTHLSLRCSWAGTHNLCSNAGFWKARPTRARPSSVQAGQQSLFGRRVS